MHHTLAIDKEDVREAGLGQRRRNVSHDRDERCWPQGYGAREGFVVVAHAVVDTRGEDRAAGLGNTAGDGLDLPIVWGPSRRRGGCEAVFGFRGRRACMGGER